MVGTTENVAHFCNAILVDTERDARGAIASRAHDILSTRPRMRSGVILQRTRHSVSFRIRDHARVLGVLC